MLGVGALVLSVALASACGSSSPRHSSTVIKLTTTTEASAHLSVSQIRLVEHQSLDNALATISAMHAYDASPKSLNGIGGMLGACAFGSHEWTQDAAVVRSQLAETLKGDSALAYSEIARAWSDCLSETISNETRLSEMTTAAQTLKNLLRSEPLP